MLDSPATPPPPPTGFAIGSAAPRSTGGLCDRRQRGLVKHTVNQWTLRWPGGAWTTRLRRVDQGERPADSETVTLHLGTGRASSVVAESAAPQRASCGSRSVVTFGDICPKGSDIDATGRGRFETVPTASAASADGDLRVQLVPADPRPAAAGGVLRHLDHEPRVLGGSSSASYGLRLLCDDHEPGRAHRMMNECRRQFVSCVRSRADGMSDEISDPMKWPTAPASTVSNTPTPSAFRSDRGTQREMVVPSLRSHPHRGTRPVSEAMDCSSAVDQRLRRHQCRRHPDNAKKYIEAGPRRRSMAQGRSG